MNVQTSKLIREVTRELDAEELFPLDLREPEMDFPPAPYDPDTIPPDTPVWRVRFDLAYNQRRCFGLNLNGELTLGRGEGEGDFLSLDAFDAEALGVSRAHVTLRPTASQLFVIDRGSTNGTWINGRSAGVNTPYCLSDGDLLGLGRLEFFVRIVERPPSLPAGELSSVAPAEVLLPIAKALIAHLDMHDVLDCALDVTLTALAAEEVSIWLIDENTNELVLQAARGLYGAEGMRLSVSETVAGKVVRTGEPVRVHRRVGGDQIKVKTGYLVEAVMYVPLTVAGVPIGVISAGHHAAGRRFSERDEDMLAHIADLTASAVQNARLFEATNRALDRHERVATSLSYALSCDVKALLNSIIGYTGLLDIYLPQAAETSDLLGRIVDASEQMAVLLDRMVEAARLTTSQITIHQRCDLLEMVKRAVQDRHRAARDKGILLNLQVSGAPYPIFGDELSLYRAALNLVDNAVKFSGQRAQIAVTLDYGPREIALVVADTGPGIPDDLLPHLFRRYFRGPSTSERRPGIGLGLEIVRAAVEAHHGTVSPRNREAGGAEFVLTLPGALRYDADEE